MQPLSYFELLGRVLLRPAYVPGLVWHIANLPDSERNTFALVAQAQHVSIRCFHKVQIDAEVAGFRDLANWAAEIRRLPTSQNAETVRWLHLICHELEQAGYPVIILNSLNHWPDLGSDVDVYTCDGGKAIADILICRFGARRHKRRLTERLASQHTFSIPGMFKPLELLCGRVGRTGEHARLCRNLASQTFVRDVGPFGFRVLGHEESIVLTALYRMYYHRDIRITDILNTTNILEHEALDFGRIKAIATSGCVWHGVAAYLRNINGYLKSLRGFGLPIPPEVLYACKSDPERLLVGDERLRIRVMPDVFWMYVRQAFEAIVRGRAGQVLRLASQPPLLAINALREKASAQPIFCRAP